MWRRFSTPASDSNAPSKLNTKENLPAPPPPPSTPATSTPKPESFLAQSSVSQPVPPVAKEHDLPIQRPAGAGQRRRSSILERLTRESTKEGIPNFVCFWLMTSRTKHDSLYSVNLVLFCGFLKEG